MKLQEWVTLPTEWIENKGLKNFKWGSAGEGADNIAALMILIALAHHADDEGVSKLTYDNLCDITNLSRAVVSRGLTVLERLRIVEREPCGRSSYKISDYSKHKGWGKLPAKRLYTSDYITAFNEFRLRRRQELNALKMYLLFVARRDRKTNMAHISYTTIEKYTGIARNDIKGGISVLTGNGLVHVEHVPSNTSEHGTANAYRLAYLDTNIHMGTRGRGMTAESFGEVVF
ncbi:MAG: hypothetical protein KC643_15925 [Nitrospira sp.]|nr:hypothetical protein [Nitrospira sp.]